jgi:hypothetical protein
LIGNVGLGVAFVSALVKLQASGSRSNTYWVKIEFGIFKTICTKAVSVLFL